MISSQVESNVFASQILPYKIQMGTLHNYTIKYCPAAEKKHFYANLFNVY